MSKARPFNISKFVVYESWLAVKANAGAEGVDGISIKEFEKDLKKNLHKIWVRMSSGTYFPPPVRAVEIPKGDGKIRVLGIPTVPDRVAQNVVKIYLEPHIDEYFHIDSYGYRPNKSMRQALLKVRERCWRYNYVIDMDIKGFFDNMDHELVMKAVRRHTSEKWILLYIERWLKAPAQAADGTITSRDRGTPQGGVISTLLANLFMHYAFDKWMLINYSNNPFERYADDVVIHCNTEKEAKELLEAVGKRMQECKLELHPVKTKIIYCKDDNRTGEYGNIWFNFLGYKFIMRKCINKRGERFMNFLPAISDKAAAKIREEVRKWNLHKRTDKSLAELADEINPKIRGWINHYGMFYKSKLDAVLKCIDIDIFQWGLRKYKKLRKRVKQGVIWLERIKTRAGKLFAHWIPQLRTVG